MKFRLSRYSDLSFLFSVAGNSTQDDKESDKEEKILFPTEHSKKINKLPDDAWPKESIDEEMLPILLGFLSPSSWLWLSLSSS